MKGNILNSAVQYGAYKGNHSGIGHCAPNNVLLRTHVK